MLIHTDDKESKTCCEECWRYEDDSCFNAVCTCHTKASEHTQIEEVLLAPEGTSLGIFQRERTDAIIEMFDNVDGNGLYPTSRFFARLDRCVDELLSTRERLAESRGRKEAKKDMKRVVEGMESPFLGTEQTVGYDVCKKQMYAAFDNSDRV